MVKTAYMIGGGAGIVGAGLRRFPFRNHAVQCHFGRPPFSHNFSPFLDHRPSVPEDERFKAVRIRFIMKEVDLYSLRFLKSS